MCVTKANVNFSAIIGSLPLEVTVMELEKRVKVVEDEVKELKSVQPLPPPIPLSDCNNMSDIHLSIVIFAQL